MKHVKKTNTGIIVVVDAMVEEEPWRYLARCESEIMTAGGDVQGCLLPGIAVTKEDMILCKSCLTRYRSHRRKRKKGD